MPHGELGELGDSPFPRRRKINDVFLPTRKQILRTTPSMVHIPLRLLLRGIHDPEMAAGQGPCHGSDIPNRPLVPEGSEERERSFLARLARPRPPLLVEHQQEYADWQTAKTPLNHHHRHPVWIRMQGTTRRLVDLLPTSCICVLYSTSVEWVLSCAILFMIDC